MVFATMRKELSCAAVLFVSSIPFLACAQSRTAISGDHDAKQVAVSSEATPRTPDGHPDLSGLWQPVRTDECDAFKDTNYGVAYEKDAQGRTIAIRRMVPGATYDKVDSIERTCRAENPNKPPYKPELQQKVKDLDENTNTYDGALHCMPLGVPRMGPPRQIVEYPGHVVFLYDGGQSSINTFRVIPSDGRAHKSDLDPLYLGDSVGHWEGDQLVVDAVGFTDRTWLASDGLFHSDSMHVIEQFTREGNNLKYEVTVDDPKVFTRAWVKTPILMKLNSDPNAALEETPPCVDVDGSHLTDNSHH